MTKQYKDHLCQARKATEAVNCQGPCGWVCLNNSPPVTSEEHAPLTAGFPHFENDHTKPL